MTISERLPPKQTKKLIQKLKKAVPKNPKVPIRQAKEKTERNHSANGLPRKKRVQIPIRSNMAMERQPFMSILLPIQTE